MNLSTVGTWADWGMMACFFVFMIVQGSKQGYWRRIWNWPFKIGTGSSLLCFLLFLVPHGGTAVTLGCVFFGLAVVSFLVFVVGFLILVSNENKTFPPRRTAD